MNSVAIIGGGITGLTAAFRLQQKGIPVTIYEAGSRVGGVIQSTKRDGYLAESGPNSILETSPTVSALIRDVGLEGSKLYSNEQADKRYIVRGGRLVSVPNTPLRFFTTKLFSPAAKARLITEPFISRSSNDHEESVEEFVVRRLGREFLNYAINPLVAGIYAGDPSQLSVKHAFPKLHALEQKHGSLILGQILGARERKRRGEVSKQLAKKFSFPGGLQDLTDALHQRLVESINLRCAVHEIEKAHNGWRIFTADGMFEHSAIILAAPAHRLARILLNSASDLLPALGNIKYPPIASVVLGFRREDIKHPLDGFGVLVPAVEQLNILGAIFSSSLFPHRAPEGHVAITCYVGGCRNPLLPLSDRPTLRRLVLEDLKKLLGANGSPPFEHYSIFPHSIPQYDVGFGQFKDMMNRIETRSHGLYFAGHYRDGISLSDSIISGENVAAKTFAFLAQSSATTSPHLSQRMSKKGILLINLGSPDSPSVPHVRKYLREFLMDGRVLDAPWLIRFGIVHFAILPNRPKQSAHAYQSIWTAAGSPLVVTSKKVRGALQSRLPIPVEVGMRYQNPSIEEALNELHYLEVDELLVIPLFPHYAMSSYETAVVRLKEIAARQAPLMKIVIQPPYYNAPDYINALVGTAEDYLSRDYDHLLFSFHGIPERHLRKSDTTGCHCLKVKNCCEAPNPAHATCYRAQCIQTMKAFVQKAGVQEGKYSIAFQSRLGRDPWLTPYTDVELERLAKAGVKKLLVICPAFVSDCLETLEEIGMRGRETFLQSGGASYTMIPCLNEHPLWIATLENMAKRFLEKDNAQFSKKNPLRLQGAAD